VLHSLIRVVFAPLITAIILFTHVREIECFMIKLGELLIERGKLSGRDMERTLLAKTGTGVLFGQALVKSGLVPGQRRAEHA
jgi:hypothetical protein